MLKFFNSCFGRVVLFLILILLLVFGSQLNFWYETRVIAFYPEGLDRFKEVKNIILANYPAIEKKLDKDPVRHILFPNQENVFGITKYNISDIIPKKDSLTIKKLWDDRYMDNDLGMIVIRNDKLMNFEVKHYGHGLYFSGYYHFITYTAGESPIEWMNSQPHLEVLKNIEIDKHWHYLVVCEQPE